MPPTPSAMRWHDAIATFIQERLKAKLDKLAEDDLKRQELLAQHQRDTWMEDAARRVTQIQAVTHSLKPIHPDARGTDRKSTRLNSSHLVISYAVFCLKKKKL